jgi:PAS domain S-box-containing protein
MKKLKTGPFSSTKTKVVPGVNKKNIKALNANTPRADSANIKVSSVNLQKVNPPNVNVDVRIFELPIKSRKQVAQGTTEVTLNTTGTNFNFKAGQYVRITIPDLSINVLKGNTRDFTISSSPNQKRSITITFRDSKSIFKKKLLALPSGEKVLVQGPLGMFTLPKDVKRPLVFIAGGIGVTTFMSMLRFLTENKIRQPVSLIYVNSTIERAAYIKELQLLSKKNQEFTLIHKLGNLDLNFIKQSIKYTPKTLWYLCGPPQMVLELTKNLPTRLRISASNIRTEEYVGYDLASSNYKIFPPPRTEIKPLTDSKAIQYVSGTLLTSVGDAALIAITDVQGTIKYVNKKFIEVAKYSKEELIGQNHRILKSGFHPPQFYQDLWKNISAGKPWRGDIKNRAKDGTFYWVDTIITPILENKKITGYLAVRFLITKRKEVYDELEKQRIATLNLLEDLSGEKKELQGTYAELRNSQEKLMTSETRLKTIFEKTSDAMFIVDTGEFNIIDFNLQAQILTGYPADKLEKISFLELFSKEQQGMAGKAINDCAIGIQQGIIKFNFKNINNKIITTEGRIARLNLEGKMHVVGSFRDVTELDRIKELNLLKNKFLAVTSHELKTPITPIRIEAQRLLKGAMGEINPKQKEGVETILRNINHLNILISDVLDIARLEADKLSLTLNKVQLGDLIQETVDNIKSQATKKNIRLAAKISALPEITCDKNRIRQVLSNLIENSLKYTLKQGEIVVEAIKQKDNILVRVRDTGIGLNKEDLIGIFDVFKQMHPSYQLKERGAGLGLSICKGIIKQHKGKIWAESQGLGKGSTFFFTLPLQQKVTPDTLPQRTENTIKGKTI